MGRKTEGKRVNDAQKHNLLADGSFIETNPPLNECWPGGGGGAMHMARARADIVTEWGG